MQKPSYLKIVYFVFKKELMAYFNSPIAYVLIAVFLIIVNGLFFKNFFLFNQNSMRAFFALLPWVFLFIAPAISMRLWAEEKKTGTIEFLLTLPITNWQVVLGKFLASVAFLGIMLLGTLTIPLTLLLLGDVDLGPVVGGYIGALFLGGAYLALGIFISSLTKNQIIAFILGLAACFIAFFISSEYVLIGVSSASANIISTIGLGSHFNSISRGVIDSRDIIFYISFIFLFLWLNKKVIEERGGK